MKTTVIKKSSTELEEQVFRSKKDAIQHLKNIFHDKSLKVSTNSIFTSIYVHKDNGEEIHYFIKPKD